MDTSLVVINLWSHYGLMISFFIFPSKKISFPISSFFNVLEVLVVYKVEVHANDDYHMNLT